MRNLPFLAALLVLCAATASAAQQPDPTLTVTVSGRNLTAAGCAPGGRVLWFAIVRDVVSMSPRMRRIVQIVPSDAQGTATLPFEKNIPPQSVWIAVDLSNGAIGIGIPKEGIAQPFLDLPEVIKNAGQARKIVSRRAQVDVLFVRPGVGAWTMVTGDGFASDEDHQNNGLVSASLDALVPVEGQAPAPRSIAKGDVLVLLDQSTFEYLATMIGGSK